MLLPRHDLFRKADNPLRQAFVFGHRILRESRLNRFGGDNTFGHCGYGARVHGLRNLANGVNTRNARHGRGVGLHKPRCFHEQGQAQQRFHGCFIPVQDQHMRIDFAIHLIGVAVKHAMPQHDMLGRNMPQLLHAGADVARKYGRGRGAPAPARTDSFQRRNHPHLKSRRLLP